MTRSGTTHKEELERGVRYEFGENWQRYLRHLNDNRVEVASASLRRMLGVDSLAGQRFLDVGCGSGLFSLAARRLGAHVVSFDYDPASVACAKELKSRYFSDDPDWEIDTGSALDAKYLEHLGHHDVVYTWGVLHHTGDMWRAIDLVSRTVAEEGRLCIALYNHQRVLSRYWWHTKRLYNRHPWLRPLLAVINGAVLLPPAAIRQALFRTTAARGMSYWYDFFDWLGGYPFETSKPEDVFVFLRERGFELEHLKTVGGGLGCNEFVFRRRLNSP